MLGLRGLFQAKNEPAGKKTSDKRDSEGKKEKASASDRYSSALAEVRPGVGQGDPLAFSLSLVCSMAVDDGVLGGPPWAPAPSPR